MQLLFLGRWFSDEIQKALGWTLVHSLWQGLLAAVLTGIIIISTRKSVARLRYNLFGAVLVLFLLSTVVTFFNELGQNNNEAVIANPVTSIGPPRGESITFLYQ